MESLCPIIYDPREPPGSGWRKKPIVLLTSFCCDVNYSGKSESCTPFSLSLPSLIISLPQAMHLAFKAPSLASIRSLQCLQYQVSLILSLVIYSAHSDFVYFSVMQDRNWRAGQVDVQLFVVITKSA